jgi:hypothetical protein
MDEPSGAGKLLRSTTVIFVFGKSGDFASDQAVDRPNTPEPTMRIEFGGLKEGEGFGEGEDMITLGFGECDCGSD